MQLGDRFLKVQISYIVGGSVKKPRFLWDPFSTHQPVLYEAVLRTEGAILEFGCGDGSTRLLHHLCAEKERSLFTFDNDWKWLSRYKEYETDWHKLIYVDDWGKLLVNVGRRSWMYCDIAFIDQGPFEARATTVQLVKETARFVIVHDIDYFPG